MAKRTLDEIRASLREIVGEERTDDAYLGLLEDLSDSYPDSSEDWQRKYNELDASWRQRYRERFFQSEDNPAEVEETTTVLEAEEDATTIPSYDDLFTET